MNKQRTSIIIAAGAGMVGTFLPWVKMPIVGSVDGTVGDGWFTFVFLGISLLIALSGEKKNYLSIKKLWGVSIMAAIATLIAIFDILNIHSKATTLAANNSFASAMASSISVGFGLYLIVLAGFSVILLAIMMKNHSHTPDAISKDAATVVNLHQNNS